ncbi:MAG TPA: LD-carboxypeptidase [Vicinamibacterales bacterium]|nr:LD-carboxypeptidase [Vicinamibacterales bacterium]
MLKPYALRSGDRLALVAPASSFDRDAFNRGVDEIRRLGFEPVYDETVFARRPFVAGEPAVRAEALRRAWRDPSIAGIVSVRGGYGSVQVLPLLDKAEVQAGRKPFVGYSDVTSLLTFLTLGCDLVCFHGPMLIGRLEKGEEGYDRDSFLRSVTQAAPLGPLSTPSLEIIKPGDAHGRLFGGTITQLAASLGTPYAFLPPPGCLLFLEEVAERPYRLDRLLMQLRLGRVLDRAHGIVFGELPRCDEPGGAISARAAVADALSDFPGPIVFGFPSGHTTGPQMTLPFGVDARLVAQGQPELIIEEAAVEARR